MRIGNHVRGGVVVDAPMRRNAALREEDATRQSDLQRVEAEDVRDGLVEIGLLALEEVAAERRAEPVGERR